MSMSDVGIQAVERFGLCGYEMSLPAAGPSDPRGRHWLPHLGEGSHGHPSCRVSQGKVSVLSYPM